MQLGFFKAYKHMGERYRIMQSFFLTKDYLVESVEMYSMYFPQKNNETAGYPVDPNNSS